MPDISGKPAGYLGRNTKLYRSTAGDAGPWTLVPETVSIEPSEPSTEKVDRTHLNSPGRRRENRLGYIDDGTVAVVCNALDATLDAAGDAIHVAIYNAQGAHDANQYWKKTAEDDAAVVHKTWIFPGDIETAGWGPFQGGAGVDFRFTILKTGISVIT